MLPDFTFESTSHTSPPIFLANSLDIYNPNPVPDKFPVFLDFSCSNLLNNFAWSCLDIPVPVSLIAITNFALSFFALISIRPFSVNLSALLIRLFKISIAFS